MTHLRTIPVALLTAVALLLTLSAPAHAWTDKVAYKRQGSVCKSDGTNVVIGSKMYQKELGKNGVTQMRIRFLLYNTDPYDGIPEVAYRRKTKESSTFPNDAKNYWWDAKNGGAQQTWSVSADSGEWWMVAKLTWVRPGKRDWNTKLPAAYCVWSPS